MNTKTIAAILAVVVVGGGIWYASSNGAKTGDSITGAQDESETTLEESTVVANPAELAGKGGQYKCTFSMTDPNADSSGTVYIEGKKFRGDFTSTVKAVNQTVNTYSISDGAYSYTWTGNTNTGFKLPVVNTGSGSGAMSGSMDFSAFGASTSWKCVGAKFDASTFTPPSNITFMESPAVKK